MIATSEIALNACCSFEVGMFAILWCVYHQNLPRSDCEPQIYHCNRSEGEGRRDHTPTLPLCDEEPGAPGPIHGPHGESFEGAGEVDEGSINRVTWLWDREG